MRRIELGGELRIQNSEVRSQNVRFEFRGEEKKNSEFRNQESE